MIKRSYVFLAVGFFIFVFHRNLDAISIVVDALIFSTSLVLIAIGFYFLRKEKKENPEVDDF